MFLQQRKLQGSKKVRPHSVLFVSHVPLSPSFYSFFVVFFFLVFCLPPYFYFHIFATKEVAGENKKCGLCVSLVPNPNLSVVSGLLAQSQQVHLATGWKILDSDFLTPKLLTQWQPWFWYGKKENNFEVCQLSTDNLNLSAVNSLVTQSQAWLSPVSSWQKQIQGASLRVFGIHCNS